MKIVVLDAYSANPGDLDWNIFSEIGELVLYDRTPAELTVERIGDAEIVLSNKVALTADVISACPNLKYIGVLATGYNIVDLGAASAANVVVTNVPAYSTDAVAQHVFALILQLENEIALYDDEVQTGAWQNSPDFTFSLFPWHELAGKNIGLVGFGNIGQKVGKVANAFGMNVMAAPQRSMNDIVVDYPVAWTPLEEIYETADIISLHCPLKDETIGMINSKSLQKMKSSAVLVNTGRGPLINERDLADALETGQIRAAALDVLSQEPPEEDNPLIGLDNCIITPHIAWASQEARRRLLNIAAGNINNFLGNKITNQVNS